MGSNNKPTSSSYIDLILTNQPNLIVLMQNAPFTSCKLSKPNYLCYGQSQSCVPSSIKRNFWDYTEGAVDGINKAISQFIWEGSCNNFMVNG